MRQRPWPLVILAVVHVLSPLGNLFLNSLFSPMGFGKYVSVFFQPHNLANQWPHLLLPVIAGIAIYRCRPWSFFIYIFAMLALLVISYFGYQQRAAEVGLWTLGIVFIVNVGVVGYFLVPTVRKIYFDPRLRWWEADLRYEASQAVKFKGPLGQEKQGTLGNISISGLFIKSLEIPEDHSLLQVQFTESDQVYTFQGQVILHQRVNALGFGVHFLSNASNKRQAQDLVRKLDQQGKLLKDRLPHDEDRFIVWVKSLFLRK
ncbi:MAG: PilZ domain-containing protein [Pseudobdellovibrionaceae bacterium]